jgi:alkanesulfonate monooxygenase SsuD/methylene tetrahydromethanopterin reductase-like flavin-dependent oxidoreductase (luciferase family)
MDFGYFTLSDNHYPDNPRSASDFVFEIRDEAILADKLGFHSAWIGEHHFDRLGVNSRPDLLLASVIPETRHIRLAPAVTVLPLHHPLHVAVWGQRSSIIARLASGQGSHWAVRNVAI